MADSVKLAAEAEARTRFVDYGAPSPKKRARVLERQVAFVSGAIWKSQQDESDAMKVAAQRAERIRELEEGREMEQDMLRNATARILELEQALEDSAARFRLLDANRSDAAAAAEAKLEKVRALCAERVSGYPDDPYDFVREFSIKVLAILDGEET